MHVLINAGTTSGGTLEYSLDNLNYSTDLPKAINADTYYVYFKVVGNDNYLDLQADYITVIISKATPVVVAPTAKTLVYNGEEQILIDAASTSGGTLQYKLDTGSYSTNQLLMLVLTLFIIELLLMKIMLMSLKILLM